MKWGEYSNDVQFILQRSEAQKTDTPPNNKANASDQPQQQKSSDQKSASLPTTVAATVNKINKNSINTSGNINNPNSKQRSLPLNNLNVNQSNNNENINVNHANSNHHLINHNNIERKSDLIGIVKGVVQEKQHGMINDTSSLSSSPPPLPASPPPSLTAGNTTDGNESPISIVSPKKLVIEFNSADVRNSLDRKTNALRNAINFSDESLDENLNEHHRMLRANGPSPSDLFKNCAISSNGALAPPPYRNPPAPRASPPPIHHSSSQPNSLVYVHQKSDSLSSNNSGGANRSLRSNKLDFLREMTPPATVAPPGTSDLNSNFMPTNDVNAILDENSILKNVQHDDLMQLIRYQRDKINSQQADITKV